MENLESREVRGITVKQMITILCTIVGGITTVEVTMLKFVYEQKSMNEIQNLEIRQLQSATEKQQVQIDELRVVKYQPNHQYSKP